MGLRIVYRYQNMFIENDEFKAVYNGLQRNAL